MARNGRRVQSRKGLYFIGNLSAISLPSKKTSHPDAYALKPVPLTEIDRLAEEVLVTSKI